MRGEGGVLPDGCSGGGAYELRLVRAGFVHGGRHFPVFKARGRGGCRGCRGTTFLRLTEAALDCVRPRYKMKDKNRRVRQVNGCWTLSEGNARKFNSSKDAKGYAKESGRPSLGPFFVYIRSSHQKVGMKEAKLPHVWKYNIQLE